MKMAKIVLPKWSGKRSKVREKSLKSQGILKRILSGNPDIVLPLSCVTGFCWARAALLSIRMTSRGQLVKMLLSLESLGI